MNMTPEQLNALAKPETPARVREASQVINAFCFAGRGHGTDYERGVYNAACVVMQNWLLGEQDYADTPPADDEGASGLGAKLPKRTPPTAPGSQHVDEPAAVS